MKTNYNELRTAQRQHISLSQYAYEVICYDSIEFMGEDNKSGFINKIIQNFYETASASISLELQRLETSFRKLLAESEESNASSVPLTSDEQRILSLLSTSRLEEIKTSTATYPKDVSLKIRLNNFVYDMLYPTLPLQWSESKHYATQGMYIKALIEEYSRKTFFEREEIFYKETLDVIKDELSKLPSNRRIFSIKYLSFTNNINVFTVKLYKLTTQAENGYHYLIGISSNLKYENSQFKPATFRLSRILDIKPYSLSHGSGKITKNQQAQLEDSIKNKGFQFLLEDSAKIQVQLSPEGLQMYRNILHLRPINLSSYTVENGDTVLTFECTASQIRYYFFQFGSKAKIVYPQTLAKDFEQMYQQAYFKYKEN